MVKIKKNRSLTLRLSEEAFGQLEKRAESKGVTVSELVRQNIHVEIFPLLFTGDFARGLYARRELGDFSQFKAMIAARIDACKTTIRVATSLLDELERVLKNADGLYADFMEDSLNEMNRTMRYFKRKVRESVRKPAATERKIAKSARGKKKP